MSSSLHQSGIPNIFGFLLGTMTDSAAAATASVRAPPPPLVFDDGSRILKEDEEDSDRRKDDDEAVLLASSVRRRRPDSVSIQEYYEVDRLVSTIQTIHSNCNEELRVALQFPDELLADAPDVCWALQERLFNHRNCLVFVLGDTTYAPCCPDTIAAAHLNANILVHYGHACLSHDHKHNHKTKNQHLLSPTITTTTTQQQTPPNDPILLYSFAHGEIHVPTCVEKVLLELQSSSSSSLLTRKLILLYELQYAHAVEELQTSLSERGELLVITGEIPSIGQQPEDTTILLGQTASKLIQQHCDNKTEKQQQQDLQRMHDGCCNTLPNCGMDDDDSKPSSCCRHLSDPQNRAHAIDEKMIATSSSTTISNSNQPQQQPHNTSETKEALEEASVQQQSSPTSTTTFYVGGLELPIEMEDDAWSNDPYNVLFIGDDSTRQYGNVVLRFLSKSQQQRPQHFYIYDPQQERILTTSVTPFQRILNRRFYLIEKAKQCTVFGILVATHFTDHMRQLVTSLRTLILDDDSCSCYTFAVGKINPAKLANFPEIQCFVLATGCPEHSILDNERELYHVPIVTPMELLMALNPEITWGSLPYSTHRQDYWKAYQSVQMSRGDNSTSNEPCKPDGDDDETDAPFFSLVSGAYESFHPQKSHNNQTNVPKNENLKLLPGKGILTQYSSAAADFLSQRTYQGLQLTVTDKDDAESNEPVQAAIPGQTGIASNYGNR